jgi:hypothetical protein
VGLIGKAIKKTPTRRRPAGHAPTGRRPGLAQEVKDGNTKASAGKRGKANKLLSGTEGDTENKAPDTDPQDNNQQPPPEKAPEHVDGEEKTWEHRFVTLSGKYNREIEEVRNVVIPENARLKDQIAKMSIKMDELHTALDELRNKPVTPAEPREVLTEEDWQVLENEDISKPVMDVIRKAINAEVSRATTPIEQRIQRTERSVEQTEKTAEQQRQELFRKAVEDRITEGTTLTFEKSMKILVFVGGLTAISRTPMA